MKHLSHPSLHRSWLEIDLGAIADNIRFYRSLAGNDCLIMPAIKADAYGHGAVEAARAALAGGADRLAVATCLEGQRLREAGIGVPVQVLGASLPEEMPVAVRYNLTVSLHDMELARQASLQAVMAGQTIPVQVKIDTGMGRLGILPEEAVAAATEIFSLPGLHFEGVFMHFADAADDAYSRSQLRRFSQSCTLLERSGITGFIRHAANSVASILYPEARLDMIRPGSGVYGYLSPAWAGHGLPLRPAMAWKSAVIQIKDYPAGSNLGYNRSFVTRRPTRVAILPLGYGDGYQREFSNRAEVLIRGQRFPVVGMVSMDYTMVDVTECADLEVGAEATLLGGAGENAITAEEMADWIGSIPYCITTGVTQRAGRIYREDGLPPVQ